MNVLLAGVFFIGGVVLVVFATERFLEVVEEVVGGGGEGDDSRHEGRNHNGAGAVWLGTTKVEPKSYGLFDFGRGFHWPLAQLVRASAF